MNFKDIENKYKALKKAFSLTAKKVEIFTKAVSKHNTKIAFEPLHLNKMQLLLNSAIYKKLNDGTWFAEIPSCSGVWANYTNKHKCQKKLKEILTEWQMT